MDELAPAYIALIRHELCLRPGTDVLTELALRLHPDDPAARPPYRAPGIVRLRRAVRRLEAGRTPASTLDEFAEDLRFLKLFEPETPSMARDAMQRLLQDVMGGVQARRTARRAGKEDPAKVVPFRKTSKKARSE
jgi:hypothetical protein